MANPKRKHSHSRTRKRRTGKLLTSLALAICPQCKSKKPPHRVCPFCGYYKNQEIISIEQKQNKKAQQRSKQAEKSEQQ